MPRPEGYTPKDGRKGKSNDRGGSSSMRYDPEKYREKQEIDWNLQDRREREQIPRGWVLAPPPRNRIEERRQREQREQREQGRRGGQGGQP